MELRQLSRVHLEIEKKPTCYKPLLFKASKIVLAFAILSLFNSRIVKKVEIANLNERKVNNLEMYDGVSTSYIIPEADSTVYKTMLSSIRPLVF